MYKYQNVSEVTQVITASGDINPREVAPGEFTISSIVIENPNFEYAGETESQRVQGAVTGVQPNAVIEAQKLENNENKEETE